MQSSTIFRLTALWALCESGLGGWMHALHLPFTGLFVGGFAILIVSLLASLPDEEERKQSSVFKRIVRATVIVLLVKAAVSPQSPPPAYIAVAFQGFAGALFFQFFSFKIAAILLGMIAMVESALQRIAIATIIYGRSLWEAIDSAFKSIVKEFHLAEDISFSAWIIVAYAGFYAIWGLLLGIWMIKLPRQISAKAREIHGQIILNEDAETTIPGRKKSMSNRIITGIIVLFFITTIFLIGQEAIGKAAYVVLRTIAVVALLVFVVNPVFRLAMKQWVAKSKGQQSRDMKDVLTILPELQGYVRPALRLAKLEQNWFRRFKAFVLTMIVLAIGPKPIRVQDNPEKPLA